MPENYNEGVLTEQRVMELLGKLLGGVPRVKIMRLFLLNPTQGFETTDVSERSRLQGSSTRRVITQLAAMDFIKRHSFIKDVIDGRTDKVKKKRVSGWFLNDAFPYLTELKTLLVEGEFFKNDELVKRLRPAGKIQLLVVSGIFIQNSDSRLDLMIVGDNLRRSYIQKAIVVLESELGKELAYAVFDTNDFKYRISMYDKLIRDVLDYPHERLIVGKDFSTLLLPTER